MPALQCITSWLIKVRKTFTEVYGSTPSPSRIRVRRMNTRSVQRALNSILGPRPSNGEEPSMRIGKDFQAEIPEQAQTGEISSEGTGSVLVWTPSAELHTENLDAYLRLAKEQFGYDVEQALGLLYWHKYNIEKSVEDLPNFCPLQDEWTMEDKVTFEQAFQYHGKNFQRIRAMLPDKPISSLVKYYYLWKKSYSQYSLMDRHARKNSRRISAGLPVSNDDTDSNKSTSSRSDNQPFSLPLFVLTGKGKQLPKGIHLSTAELVALAGDTDHLHVKQLDREILETKDKIQLHKQQLMGGRDDLLRDSIEDFRPLEFTKKAGLSGPTRWSEEEIQIALEVIQQHGKDYEALSSSLENKTLAQCRNFFTNYKRKLNLPRLIAEYEIRHGQKLSRYSKQARDYFENGVQGDGDGDSAGVDVGYQGEVLLEVAPQTKRLRLGNSGMEYSDITL